MARKKISELNQTDGKIRQGESPEKPQVEITTLDQLFGDTGLGKYGTLDKTEFETKINDMDNADLRRYAVEVAHVAPAVSPERTRKRLMVEFAKHAAVHTMPRITHTPEKAPSKEALKIMSECK